MDGQFVRRNGYHQPFDPLQMLSWVLFGYFFVSFYVFYVPLFETPVAISLALIFFVLALVVAVSDVLSTKCKPDDMALNPSGKAAQHASADDESELLYCYFCKKQVHSRSKHCRRCNKCIHQFDHHCRWLNNCVGGANYQVFLVLIISVYLLLIMHVVVGATLLSRWVHEFQDRDVSGWHITDLGIVSNPNGLLAMLVVTLTLALAAFGLISQLLFFHLYIIYNKMSTYDYILKQREKSQQKEKTKRNNRTRVAAEPMHESSSGPPAAVWNAESQGNSGPTNAEFIAETSHSGTEGEYVVEMASRTTPTPPPEPAGRTPADTSPLASRPESAPLRLPPLQKELRHAPVLGVPVPPGSSSSKPVRAP